MNHPRSGMHSTNLLFSCSIGSALLVPTDLKAKAFPSAEIRRSTSRQADFDGFSNQQLVDLSKAPMNAIPTSGKDGEVTINHFMRTIDLSQGKRQRGQRTRSATGSIKRVLSATGTRPLEKLRHDRQHRLRKRPLPLHVSRRFSGNRLFGEPTGLEWPHTGHHRHQSGWIAGHRRRRAESEGEWLDRTYSHRI
jgi:hypothetical protein